MASGTDFETTTMTDIDWNPSRSIEPLRPYLGRIAHDVATRIAAGEPENEAIAAAIRETLLAQGYDPEEAEQAAAELAARHGAMIRAYAREHDRVLANDRAQGHHVNR